MDDIILLLNKICSDIASHRERGHYSKALFELASAEDIPKPVSELAESFARLLVEIEARELSLEGKIEELSLAKAKLEEYSRLLEDRVAIRDTELKTAHTLLLKSESQNLEFKSSLRWDYREGKPNRELEKVIVKTIAGFLNADGGILFIGVDDNGVPLGLENDYSTLYQKDSDGFEQCLTSLVSENLGVEQNRNLTIAFHPMESHEVCSITVKPNTEPVFVEKFDGSFFARIGNSTRRLNPRETTDYISKRFSR